MSRKPVLISGAGLSSLLLGRSLLQSSIPFVIYERDESISYRAQGYRLRLSSEGLDAIESVLGPIGFTKFWDRCGKTAGGQSGGMSSINALTGEQMAMGRPKTSAAETSHSPQDATVNPAKEQLTSRQGQTIGISRGDMRALFLEGCQDHVRWGHQIVGYERTAHGVTAVFEDGSTSEEGSMLIAGDGVYSRIAKQVSGGRLKTFDTGARGIHGQAPTTAFKGLGEGVWRLLDESRPDGKVFAITNVRSGDMDDPDISFGWTMGGQPGVIQPPNDNFAIIGKPAADMAKNLTKDWAPRLRPLFDEMNESEAAFWKITCSSPSGVPEWERDTRVTVIGDAAHSMTPAGGLGANTAMRDSALLGRLLHEAEGWNEDVTAAFEAQMRVYEGPISSTRDVQALTMFRYASAAVKTSYGMATAQFGVCIDEQTSPTVG